MSLLDFSRLHDRQYNLMFSTLVGPPGTLSGLTKLRSGQHFALDGVGTFRASLTCSVLLVLRGRANTENVAFWVNSVPGTPRAFQDGYAKCFEPLSLRVDVLDPKAQLHGIVFAGLYRGDYLDLLRNVRGNGMQRKRSCPSVKLHVGVHPSLLDSSKAKRLSIERSHTREVLYKNHCSG